MGWKKTSNLNSNDMYNFNEMESSIINWENTSGQPGEWSIDGLKNQIDFYYKSTIGILKYITRPTSFIEYDHKFIYAPILERIENYPCFSSFENTEYYFSTRFSSYNALILRLSLVKFCYFTTERFYSVFKSIFGKKDINDGQILRVFFSMKQTTIDCIEEILKNFIEISELADLDPYKNHFTIEELIDYGDQQTYHWSKMYDQIIDLTIEAYNFETIYGEEPSNQNFNDYSYDYTGDEDFEDFFEKTKTLVFNDEVNEAFMFFGLNKSNHEDEFKKEYRKMAKRYHPDVNSDANAVHMMRKINIYKNIIETYYDSI